MEDFDKAKRFLEALGYQKLVYYEKYRTTYALSQISAEEIQGNAINAKDPGNLVQVMLDELPYGNFVEIEGETVELIHGLANQLGLNRDAAIATSYSTLFDRACRNLKVSLQDLSFAEFKDIRVDPAHLGVQAADI